MSFILDALKKSESDRQRQSGPSLFEVRVAPPRRSLPVWAVAIAVLLGINIVVVSWMLLRRPAAQQPAPAGVPPAAAPAAAASGTADTAARTVPLASPTRQAASGQHADAAGARTDALSGSDAPPPEMAGGTAAAGAGMARAVAPAAAAAGAAPRGGSTQPPSAASAPSPSDAADQGSDPGASPSGGSASDYAPAVQPAAGTGGSGSNLPLYQQIASNAGIPELHLDLHVFAERPKDRFVMINMHRLGEGDSLPNGVQVEAIRPDGVELSYHGRRFLLPRN